MLLIIRGQGLVKKKGFTIIELVITITVLAAMGWMGVSAMLSGIDAWSNFIQRKELVLQGKMSLNRMTREIRMIKDLTSVITADSAVFELIDVNNVDITYSLNSGALERTEDAVTNTLATGASSLSFTYYDADNSIIISPVVAPSETDIRRVRINMSLAKNLDIVLNLRSDVKPRNLE